MFSTCVLFLNDGQIKLSCWGKCKDCPPDLCLVLPLSRSGNSTVRTVTLPICGGGFHLRSHGGDAWNENSTGLCCSCLCPDL